MKTIQQPTHVDADLFDQLNHQEQETLSQLLEQYLSDLENGIHRSADELLAQHPELGVHGIEDKLREYLTSIDLLFSATGNPTTPTSDDPHELQQLGDFQIIREIGRGGMGVVYEATQKSLGRQVALKVLPFAAVLDKRQIARFQNEAQAAAQLHHPNIVPVYSVGCDRGVHYYSMQYIDGQSLDHVIDQSINWQAKPTGKMPAGKTPAGKTPDGKSPDGKSPVGRTRPTDPNATTEVDAHFATEKSVQTNDHVRAVTKIVIQAALALEHAHAFGVVHRDIKPSNLLIDGEGQLWVTDFGLARCQTSSKITMTGHLVGTLRYMSPEAAGGRNAIVDHLSDLYSLGVTLYELLTLRPAHVESDRTSLMESIRDSEPTSARKINPAIPMDLETILNKSIAKSRDDRYESAKDFADDLQRFLDGKPTFAKRPSLVDRAAKWASRHKRFVAAAAVMLLVVAAAATTTVGMLHTEANKTKNALAIAQTNYRQSQANLGKAIEAVDRFGMRVANQLVGIPGAERVRRDILRETLDDYTQLAKQFENDSQVSFPLALCHIASIHRGLGELDLAQQHLTRAAQLYKKLDSESRNAPGIDGSAPQSNPVDRVLLDHAVCLNNLGEVHYKSGNLDLAEQNYRSSLVLTQSAESRRSQPKVDRVRAAAMVNLGNLFRATGRTDKSLAVYRDALDIQMSLHQADPSNTLLSREMAVSLAQLAFLNADRDLTAASQYNQRAIEIHQELVNDDPTDLVALSELSTCFNHRGRIFHQENNDNAAEQAYQDSIRVQKQLVQTAPSVARFREQLAVAHNNLGQMLCSNESRQSAAIEHFRSAQRLLSELAKTAPQAPHYAAQLGGALGNLAPMLESEQPSTAAKLYQQAIEHQEQAIKRAPRITEFRRWLSSNYFKYARFLRSQHEFDKAAAMAMKRSGLWNDDAEHQFRIAIELADAAAAADSRPTVADRIQATAVQQLNKAISLGLVDHNKKIAHIAFEHLKTHPDFPAQVQK